MLRITRLSNSRCVSGLVPRGNNKGNRWPLKHSKDYWLDATFIKNRAKRIAFTTPPPEDKWAIPSHPKDVIREEIIEDHFNRKKSIRHPLDAPLFDEERYASFPLAIGTVHRRIGRDRVEIVITEAKYHEFTQKFTKEQGLIVVHDEGQTRIGDFILAKLVDKNNRISTHNYMRTIRVKGMAVCPFTGMRVRQNRLVDEPALSIEESHALFDATASDRIQNYKYRDDLNRDYTFYELKWNDRMLTEAIEEGKRVKDDNAKEAAPVRVAEKRRQRINRIKNILA